MAKKTHQPSSSPPKKRNLIVFEDGHAVYVIVISVVVLPSINWGIFIRPWVNPTRVNLGIEESGNRGLNETFAEVHETGMKKVVPVPRPREVSQESLHNLTRQNGKICYTIAWTFQ